MQAGVRKLQDTLESLTGIGDATASELFERHNTPLAHAMTLFFLCRDCVDLFNYHSDRLGEMDWLAPQSCSVCETGGPTFRCGSGGHRISRPRCPIAWPKWPIG